MLSVKLVCELKSDSLSLFLPHPARKQAALPRIIRRLYIFDVYAHPRKLKKQLVRPDLFAMFTDTGIRCFIRIGNASALHGSFDRMVGIIQNGGNVYEELSAAFGVLSAFYEEYRPRIQEIAPHSAKRLSDSVNAYIEQNCADNIKIADIAASTGLCCANDLSRTICEYYKRTPTEIRFEKYKYDIVSIFAVTFAVQR